MFLRVPRARQVLCCWKAPRGSQKSIPGLTRNTQGSCFSGTLQKSVVVWQPRSIPGKHIEDFFNAVIDSLVPSTPRSPQAPIFQTDGEVMIHSHNQTLWEPGLVSTCPRGNCSPGQVQGRCRHTRPRNGVLWFPLSGLPISPERHRGVVPVAIYETRQTEACSIDPGQLRTIQQVSGPAAVHLPIWAPA